MKTQILLCAIVLGGFSYAVAKPVAAVAATPTALVQTKPLTHSTGFWRSRRTGQRYPLPESIGGRPVAYYLANPRVSALAKALYTGRFQPSDTDSTTQLLALVTTTDKEIRPFYRWCLDFTIVLSDGALGEYPGKPALAYATKYPQEFFAYTDKDASGQRYKRWVELMAYSGLNDYHTAIPSLKKGLIARLKQHCQHCTPLLDRRIERLATDIIAVAIRNDR
jgi:hypothetical protein